MRSSGRVRETRWFSDTSTGLITLGAASTATLVGSLTAEELALRPFTIVRTRGVWHVASDQTAATERYDVALGIAVVSEQASAIGVTAIPTPSTDDGSDLWMVYERMMSQHLIKSLIGFVEPAGTMQVFDSKAMRKVEDGQDVVKVVETSAASLGATVRSYARQLIKLH